MSGRDILTTRRALAVTLIAMAMVVILLTRPEAEVAKAQTTSPLTAERVAEIRFGVIDPPVVYQREFKEFYTTNNTTKETKPLEFAGMAFVNGQLLIMSDRHEHCVFSSQLDLKNMRVTTPVQVVIQPNEQYLIQDAESITLKTGPEGSITGYVFSSMSNDRNEQPLPQRRHLARFSFPSSGSRETIRATVIDGTPIREKLTAYFEKLGINPYRTYYADASSDNKNTYRWGNIEGITFTPDGERLMVGMRNPLTSGQSGHAILFMLEDLDQAFDAGDARQVKISDIFTLDLGDRGVSDLCWDPMTKGYLIAAGKSNGLKLDKDQPFPPNTLDSALFWWSGRKTEKPILFATVPEMKIEAICRLGTSRMIAIGSDEGDESEGRAQRQSVITIMDFTGFNR